MARGRFKRIGKVIVPVNADGREAFAAVKDGDEFDAEFFALKNKEQVNLFFAMRDLVCEAKDSARVPTKEWLLESTGFADPIWYPDGRMKLQARSIAGMRQVEFDQFFQKAIALIQETLEIADRNDLLKHLFDLLDPTTRAYARKRVAQLPPERRRREPRTAQQRAPAFDAKRRKA